MSSLIWDLATSSPCLGVIAAVLAAAFAVSHLPRLVTWLRETFAAFTGAGIQELIEPTRAWDLCPAAFFREILPGDLPRHQHEHEL